MFKFGTAFVVSQTAAAFALNDVFQFQLSSDNQASRPLFARAAVAAADIKPGVVVEPITDTKYPTTIQCEEQQQALELIGVGVRSKKILGLKNINVYSVGMYANKQKVKKQLKGKQDYSEDSQYLYDDMINSSLSRALRMVVVFKMSKQAFWNAMNSRLTKPMNAAGEQKSLEAFKNSVDTAFDRGTVVLFSATPDGTLVTRINGQLSGVVKSSELCKNVFDIYLGDEPPSPQAKQQIGRGLMDIINSD